MGGRLRGGIHRHSEMLLRHLLGELELVCVGRHIRHLSLHLKISGKVLLGLDHAHVDILLVCCSNLLLLLLKYFNLLGDGELFHCTNSSAHARVEIRGKTHSSAGSAQTDYVDERCAGDGRQDP